MTLIFRLNSIPLTDMKREAPSIEENVKVGLLSLAGGG